MGAAHSLLTFDLDTWEYDAESLYGANCYNYAVNLMVSRYSGGEFMRCLSPGEISVRRRFWPDKKRIAKELKRLKDPESLMQKMFDARRFEHYVETRLKNFTDDGLIFLGQEASFPDKGYPMALFFRGMDEQSHSWFRRLDYHWYCLRRDDIDRPFWACKFLNSGIKILDGESIFTHALNKGYNHFGGYFCRPWEMDV